MRILFTLFVLALLPWFAIAQEDKKEATTQQEQTEKQESIEQTPPGNVKTAETFVPSEEVSEDLSVSFPIDI